MTGYGVREADIAGVIGIAPRRHCMERIDRRARSLMT